MARPRPETASRDDGNLTREFVAMSRLTVLGHRHSPTRSCADRLTSPATRGQTRPSSFAYQQPAKIPYPLGDPIYHAFRSVGISNSHAHLLADGVDKVRPFFQQGIAPGDSFVKVICALDEEFQRIVPVDIPARQFR